LAGICTLLIPGENRINQYTICIDIGNCEHCIVAKTGFDRAIVQHDGGVEFIPSISSSPACMM